MTALQSIGSRSAVSSAGQRLSICFWPGLYAVPTQNIFKEEGRGRASPSTILDIEILVELAFKSSI